jgi:hypothetical protein
MSLRRRVLRITSRNRERFFLAKVDANRTLDLKPEKANPEEEREQQKLDLGNGNTVVAPSTNLHATWKI